MCLFVNQFSKICISNYVKRSCCLISSKDYSNLSARSNNQFLCQPILLPKQPLRCPVRQNSVSNNPVKNYYEGVFKSVTESDTVSAVKDALVAVHDVSGLPWGATIILTTLGLRVLITFPLGVYQTYVLARLELVRIEFGSVVQELKKETAVAIKRFGWTEKQARAVYNASLKTQWRLIVERDNCHPLKTTLVVWIQLPLWILLSLAFRCMSYKYGQDPALSETIAEQLSVEGIAWVSNLLHPDPVGVLPFTVSAANLAIIELQAASKLNPTRTQRILTNVFRGLALVSFPIALSVPSCMSLYWSMSSILALTQNVALMSPRLRRAFGIPATPSQHSQPYRYAWTNFKAKWLVSPVIINKTRNMEYKIIPEGNNFKNSFKYYKQKERNEFSLLVTFEEDNKLQLEGAITRREVSASVSSIFGVVPTLKWKSFSIVKRPGVVVIRNPFTPLGQRYWVTRCLRDFPRKPNKRNIDIDAQLQNVDQLWEHCRDDSASFDKLRWATLGYHHNWDTKLYSEDRKSTFPPDLSLLSEHFARALGYSDFQAEAAIVNFYHPGTTLSGHVDRSEVALDAPLLSFSFGQSAIFLVGGPTLDDEGVPLLLQSGDVLLMSRDARLCYHAVPRILPAATTPWSPPPGASDSFNADSNAAGFDATLLADAVNDVFWSPFEKFVSRSRINMNVRQVLPSGQQCLVPIALEEGIN